jgi:hypothetical protein
MARLTRDPMVTCVMLCEARTMGFVCLTVLVWHVRSALLKRSGPTSPHIPTVKPSPPAQTRNLIMVTALMLVEKGCSRSVRGSSHGTTLQSKQTASERTHETKHLISRTLCKPCGWGWSCRLICRCGVLRALIPET